MEKTEILRHTKELIPMLHFKFPYSAEEWSEKLIIENYHSHSNDSNPSTVDSPISKEDYAKHNTELGRKCLFTMEHGWQGNQFKNYDIAEKYGLKYIHGTEAYWVKDRHEADRTNCHIIVHAVNAEGREDINFALSRANEDGYYYKPRIDLELLFDIPKDNVIVTSACIAGWHYEDAEQIWLKIHEHFGNNFFLEVQPHNTQKQKELNKKILKLSQKTGIQLIAGMDSHYIVDDDDVRRDQLLEYKGITYPDEEGWYLDDPDGFTAMERFIEQGVLSNRDIIMALMNTNIFSSDYVKPIVLDRSFKIPTLFPDDTYEQKVKRYHNLLSQAYKAEKRKSKEKVEGIRYEAKQVVDSKVVDYFLTSHAIVKDAVENEGGVLTTTSRGSAASFYTNKLLGLTTVDRFEAEVPIYPERFLTAERVNAGSMPDIDLNITEQAPFVRASRKLLGDHGCYPLMTIGVLKEKSAWQLYATNANVDAQTVFKISKYIDAYNKALKHADDDMKDTIQLKDYIPDPYYDIFMQSKDYQSITMQLGVHACFPSGQLVLTDKGYKEIQDVCVGDNVLSHDNEYHQVIDTMVRDSNNIWRIKTTGDDLLLTNNHPLYVRSNINVSGTHKIFSEPYWKKAEELTKDDWIGSPINNKSIIPTCNIKSPEFLNEYLDMSDPDLWWLIGRYMGDGWTENPYCSSTKDGIHHRVIICCNKNNNELLDIMTKIPKYLHFGISEYRTTYKLVTENQVLYYYLQQFGKYAQGKHLTNDILDLPRHLLQSFLDGYLSADGSQSLDTVSRELTFSTVSRELAYGLQQCIHKAYHVPCTIRTTKPGVDIIEGRSVNRRKKYRGRFMFTNSPNTVNKVIDGMIWFKVKDVSKTDNEGKVYNLSVNKANSYTVNNLAVHNCGHMLLNGDIRREVGLVSAVSESTGKRTLVAAIEGGFLDEFGYVKEDFLIVDSVGLTYELFQAINQPVPSFDDLRDMVYGDKATWDIYEKGITVAVNQCEQDATRQKVMKFKPQSLAELAQFIAAIRPGFASLLNTFLNRQEYSTGEPKIDDLLSDTTHFMIYQESIMKVLGFLGLEMGETYKVIKSISKKKLKGEKKEHLLQELRVAWQKDFDNMDNFERVWKVISDAAAYSFNAPHALSMAGDSLYAAWFKAHHTAVFYEVAIRHYQKKGKKEKVAALFKEALQFFGYVSGSYKFGDDNRLVHVDEKRHVITPNLSIIKGFGETVAEKLCELGKNKPKTFYGASLALKNVGINSTIVSKLIQIDYFDCYGDIPTLLRIQAICEGLDYGEFKQLSKKKINDLNLPIELIAQYGHETKTLYNQIDVDTLYPLLFKNLNVAPLNVALKLRWESEILGVCTTTIPGADSHYYVVQDIDEKKAFTNLTLYRVTDGRVNTCKIWNRRLESCDPIEVGSLLYVRSTKKEHQREKSGEINPVTGKPIYVPIPDKFEYWLDLFSVEEKIEE